MAIKQKIAPLTSLRFFAALLVVLFHTVPDVVRRNPWIPIDNLIHIGNISVSFFYTLSGYILAVVYLRGEKPFDRKRFWEARFARIYPLFLLALLLDLPDYFFTHVGQLGTRGTLIKEGALLLGNIVMLQAWIPALHMLNDPAWSLSVETLFYFLFPLIGWWLWKRSAGSALLVSLLFYAAGMLAVIFLPLPVPILTFNPVLYVHEFLIGILIARWHTVQLAEPNRALQLQRLAPWLTVLALGLFALAVHWVYQIPSQILIHGLLLPVYALIMVAVASGNKLLDWLLSPTWLVILGEASYGLYLLHWPIIAYWRFLGLESHPALYPLYLALAIGSSVVLFYFFETPARKWILQKLHTQSRETTLSSSIAQ